MKPMMRLVNCTAAVRKVISQPFQFCRQRPYNSLNNCDLLRSSSRFSLPLYMPIRPVSIQGNDLKKGTLINLDGDIFEVLKTQHTRSGKGGAFVQADIRSLTRGAKITKRFRSRGEKVDEVVVDEVSKYQVLELTQNGITRMHTETFEQIDINRSLVTDGILVEGLVITVYSSNNKALKVDLPTYLELTVKNTSAIYASSTDTSYKPVQTEEGPEIRVPMFIESGTTVKLRCSTGEYIERV